MTDDKRVALALGSGGARGYAHIGVIAELDERGYEIAGVAGSSMGALVGGLYAAGSLDAFTDYAKSLNGPAVLRLLDPSWAGAGVFRAQKILDLVRGLLDDAEIERLPFPYTAVATDLIAGRSIWLQRGPLDVAIRASIAIPGVISPCIDGGRVLADGGILDPLPVSPLAGTNADLTIAVSLNGADPDARYRRGDEDSRAGTEWLNRLMRSTSALLDTTAARSVLSRIGAAPDPALEQDLVGSAEETDEEFAASDIAPKLGSFELMNRTIEVMQGALARHQLATYPPDILIEVPRTSSRMLMFHRAADLIDLGRELAARALDTFEAEEAARQQDDPPAN